MLPMPPPRRPCSRSAVPARGFCWVLAFRSCSWPFILFGGAIAAGRNWFPISTFPCIGHDFHQLIGRLGLALDQKSFALLGPPTHRSRFIGFAGLNAHYRQP